MPCPHPLLTAQSTVHALLDGVRADFALYAGATPGCVAILSDVRLLAQWVMYAVEQTRLDHYIPQDVLSAVSLHRKSASWPHGRYWRSARIVPSALDTAAGASLALRVISIPGVALAVSVIKDMMENANNSGP